MICGQDVLCNAQNNNFAWFKLKSNRRKVIPPTYTETPYNIRTHITPAQLLEKHLQPLTAFSHEPTSAYTITRSHRHENAFHWTAVVCTRAENGCHRLYLLFFHFLSPSVSLFKMKFFSRFIYLSSDMVGILSRILPYYVRYIYLEKVGRTGRYVRAQGSQRRSIANGSSDHGQRFNAIVRPTATEHRVFSRLKNVNRKNKTFKIL